MRTKLILLFALLIPTMARGACRDSVNDTSMYDTLISSPVFRTAYPSTGTVITPEGREMSLDQFVKSGEFCKWREFHEWVWNYHFNKGHMSWKEYICGLCGKENPKSIIRYDPDAEKDRDYRSRQSEPYKR